VADAGIKKFRAIGQLKTEGFVKANRLNLRT
jgi:hypothetical protein